jgi:hypothetical protein
LKPVWGNRCGHEERLAPCARSEYPDRTPENHRGRRRHRRVVRR